MVHGQVLPPHLVVAVMANSLLDSPVPPVGPSQAPGLFLFPSYLFIADSAEIEAHMNLSQFPYFSFSSLITSFRRSSCWLS